MILAALLVIGVWLKRTEDLKEYFCACKGGRENASRRGLKWGPFFKLHLTQLLGE